MAKAISPSNQTPNRDRALGMDRPIARRDFLNGAAIAIGALGAGAALPAFADTPDAWPQEQPGYYPPTRTGMRGSHPGAFEAAHHLRDGDLHAGWTHDTHERYDLVIVGGGISGLSAAHFWRKARPDAKILILDNHDDFGGHAKRNEFHLDGKLHLMNGGTLEIDSPRPYSPVADGLLRTLGVEPVALAEACDKPEIYGSLGLKPGVFFDKETFGADKLVIGAPRKTGSGDSGWAAFAARTPLSPTAQADLVRVETGEIDYMPGLSSAEKKDRLSRMSYRAYLSGIVKVDPAVLAYYQTLTQGYWSEGIDAVSALDCWGMGAPGFAGLKLDKGSAPRMSFTPAGYADGSSYSFHFPDGNASIARLLVRDLIPGSAPGKDALDIVTAPFDYTRLDQPDNAVRLRLSSIVVRVKHRGDPDRAKEVEVVYLRGDKPYAVRAKNVVLASWNMMIPYLCPELPAAQKDALHALVKTPLVYSTVALRNWTAFQKLGLAGFSAPGGYHTSARLNWPVDIGDYRSERAPERPVLLHMGRYPCKPGLSEQDQNRAGRAELLATPFETFEREIRAQLGRVLAEGGFDPATDITAITVNRWPHGYAPEWNPLWQGDPPEAERAHVLGRVPFGRISIANADSGGGAYTDVAIDQAWRAVNEQLAKA